MVRLERNIPETVQLAAKAPMKIGDRLWEDDDAGKHLKITDITPTNVHWQNVDTKEKGNHTHEEVVEGLQGNYFEHFNQNPGDWKDIAADARHTRREYERD